jgi:hypothetical protein
LTSRAAGTALLVAAYGGATAAVLSVVGVLIAICLGYDIEYSLTRGTFKFKPPGHLEYEAGRHEEFKQPSKEKPPEVNPDKRQEVPAQSAKNEQKPRDRLRYYYYTQGSLDAYLDRILKAPCVPGFDFPEVCSMNKSDRGRIILRSAD